MPHHELEGVLGNAEAMLSQRASAVFQVYHEETRAIMLENSDNILMD